MNLELYKNLSYFLGAYFHQDWRCEYDSADQAVAAFASENSDRLSDVIREATNLLNEHEFIVAPIDTLIHLDGYYNPGVDGQTASQWIKSVIDKLSRYKIDRSK